MLTAPRDLDEGVLAAAVERGWGLRVAGMSYLAVGWGSHHWEVADGGGGRWFVTVDEVANKRLTGGESLDEGFGRLRASLRAAVDLKDAGREFVVTRYGPSRGAGRASGREVRGRRVPVSRWKSFSWARPPSGAGCSRWWRPVHTTPVRALTEEFAVPFRDRLEAVCADRVDDCGPYARRVAELCREHAPGIRHCSGDDDLVSVAGPRPTAQRSPTGTHPGTRC